MLFRFDPFAEFDRLSRAPISGAGRGFMAADGYRTGDAFVLHIDMPGVDPDAIDMTVDQNTLTISVDRGWDVGDAEPVMQERPSGAFTRRFFLGENLDTEHIDAGYDHGVLTVSIPMRETARARKITVGTADKALTG